MLANRKLPTAVYARSITAVNAMDRGDLQQVFSAIGNPQWNEDVTTDELRATLRVAILRGNLTAAKAADAYGRDHAL